MSPLPVNAHCNNSIRAMISESATLNAGLVSCVVFILNTACEDNLFQPSNILVRPELLVILLQCMYVHATYYRAVLRYLSPAILRKQ